MNLTPEGHLPRVDIQAAVNELRPFQVPPNAIKISLGKTEDYWKKAHMDRFLTLSIGTPITSDLAFMTMFNEQGRIDGGLNAKTDDYGSERLYTPKRYPESLRMLSKEVDDVLFGGLKPLDVLTSRVPHCSMPAPEIVQMKVTTAYMYKPGSGRSISDGVLGCQTVNGICRLFHSAGSADLRPSVARKGYAGKHPGNSGL